MPKTTPVPSDFAIGQSVRFKAGPSQVERSGTVTGHEGQFVLVDVANGDKVKSMKTRPGAIFS